MPYTGVMQVVIETPGYLDEAKDVGLTDDEMINIVDFVAGKPDAGAAMKGRTGRKGKPVAS